MEIRWGLLREQTTIINKPKHWFIDDARRMNNAMPIPIVLEADVPPCLGALLEILSTGPMNVMKSFLQAALATADLEIAATNAMIFYYEKLLLYPSNLALSALESVRTALYAPYGQFLQQVYAAIGQVNIYGRKVLTAEGYQKLINDCLPVNLAFKNLDIKFTRLEGLINQYRLDNSVIQDTLDLLQAFLAWLIAYKQYAGRIVDAINIKL